MENVKLCFEWWALNTDRMKPEERGKGKTANNIFPYRVDDDIAHTVDFHQKHIHGFGEYIGGWANASDQYTSFRWMQFCFFFFASFLFNAIMLLRSNRLKWVAVLIIKYFFFHIPTKQCLSLGFAARWSSIAKAENHRMWCDDENINNGMSFSLF